MQEKVTTNQLCIAAVVMVVVAGLITAKVSTIDPQIIFSFCGAAVTGFFAILKRH